MNTSSKCLFLALFAIGCQPDDYIDPQDENTGTPPPDASVIYAFDASSSAAWLDSNLAQANAPAASFQVVDGALVPAKVNGAWPASAGSDANIVHGDGFGTYVNPDFRGEGVAWADADPFRSVLTANVTLTNPGDTVRFCRSFATTCVELIFDPTGTGGGVGVAVMRLAANLPDTEIGVIASGVSAAIRGTGDSGLTVALADPSLVALPFLKESGTELALEWSVERGALEGSLDWTVSVDGVEIGSGNTLGDIAGAIVKDAGVALIFDEALGDGTIDLDYAYSWNGTSASAFTNPTGLGPDLSPQPFLARTPLYVYPTEDAGYSLLTQTGAAGATHEVQAADAVVGAVADEGSGERFVYSTTFNGDDFAGTPGAGALDFGIVGGGFYPSPSFCYSQIVPLVEGGVRAGVRTEVHRAMYAAVGNGTLQADAALTALSFALSNEPFTTTFGVTPASVAYTTLGDIGSGDVANYILIGEDYADNNVDANITTSATTTYAATLTESVSLTYKGQLDSIIAVLEANNFAVRDALIGGGGMTLQDYIDLKTLQAGLTGPPGSMDGIFDGVNPVLDNGTTICGGYECNVGVVLDDIITGSNNSGLNGTAGVPALAAGCLWGQAAVPEQPAVPATLTGSLADHPAYDAQAALPAVVPVREQAAASMNSLVLGLYGQFHVSAFGPGVPISNFSMVMAVGDPAADASPSVTSFAITTTSP